LLFSLPGKTVLGDFVLELEAERIHDAIPELVEDRQYGGAAT
jgi:hypothetical protein